MCDWNAIWTPARHCYCSDLPRRRPPPRQEISMQKHISCPVNRSIGIAGTGPVGPGKPTVRAFSTCGAAGRHARKRHGRSPLAENDANWPRRPPAAGTLASSRDTMSGRAIASRGRWREAIGRGALAVDAAAGDCLVARSLQLRGHFENGYGSRRPRTLLGLATPAGRYLRAIPEIAVATLCRWLRRGNGTDLGHESIAHRSRPLVWGTSN